MLKIKNVSAKNFMSVGNVTQAVRFTNNGLTLVLGNNVSSHMAVSKLFCFLSFLSLQFALVPSLTTPSAIY